MFYCFFSVIQLFAVVYAELVLATNCLSLLEDSNGGNLVILCIGRFHARVDDICLVPMLGYDGTILRKYWYLGTSPDNNLIPMSGYNGTNVFYFGCLSLVWTQTVGYQAFLGLCLPHPFTMNFADNMWFWKVRMKQGFTLISHIKV